MEVKFTALELAYLQKIQGYAIVKAREAAKAQEIAQEAQALVTEYLKCLARIHGVDDTNPVPLPDFSGLSIPVGSVQAQDPEKG